MNPSTIESPTNLLRPAEALGFLTQKLRLTIPFGAALTGILLALADLRAARGGELVDWGNNNHGQLDGTPSGPFIAVAAGDYHSVGIRDDQTLSAWGWDVDGVVSGVPSGTFVAVAAGRYNNVAIRTDGTLASWGDNGYNQVSATPGGTFEDVTSGQFFCIGIRTDGTLSTWGDGSPNYGIPANTPSGTFIDVAGGWDHAVAVRSDGTLVSWGNDNYGQVSQTPAGTFKAVAAGIGFTVAIRTDGSLAVWGSDISQVMTAAPSGTFTALSAKFHSCLALRTDGRLVAWGQSYPAPAGFYTAIAVGREHGVAFQEVQPNQAPIAHCRDIIVAAGPDCSADASIDDGSHDPDANDTITVTQSPAGPYPLGQTLVTLTVTDSHGESSVCEATVTVVDDTAPSLTHPIDITENASSASGTVVNFPAPETADACSSVDVSFDPPSGSLFQVGSTVVTCTATDAAGNSSESQFVVQVLHSWSGAMQPLNPDGSSVFRAGSVVPVRFRLTGGSSANPDLVARLSYVKLSNSVPGPVNEADSPGNGSAGNTFRYDATTGEYSFNWSTRGLSAGSYQLRIDLGDGVVRLVNVGLR